MTDQHPENAPELPADARKPLQFATYAQIHDLIDYLGDDLDQYPGATRFASRWYVPRAEALAWAERHGVPVRACFYCQGEFPDDGGDFGFAGPWQTSEAPTELVCFNCADMEGVTSCSGCNVLLPHVELEDEAILCSGCQR